MYRKGTDGRDLCHMAHFYKASLAGSKNRNGPLARFFFSSFFPLTGIVQRETFLCLRKLLSGANESRSLTSFTHPFPWQLLISHFVTFRELLFQSVVHLAVGEDGVGVVHFCDGSARTRNLLS